MTALREPLETSERLRRAAASAQDAVARAYRETAASLREMSEQMIDARDVAAFEIEKTELSLQRLEWTSLADRARERELRQRKADLEALIASLSREPGGWTNRDLRDLYNQLQTFGRAERSPHDPEGPGIFGS